MQTASTSSIRRYREDADRAKRLLAITHMGPEHRKALFEREALGVRIEGTLGEGLVEVLERLKERVARRLEKQNKSEM